jgi:hypothetical protein
MASRRNGSATRSSSSVLSSSIPVCGWDAQLGHPSRRRQFARHRVYAPHRQITTTQTLDGTTPQVNVTADVNGLTPSTEYHYRLVVADVTGAWTTGDDPTFTTPAG